MLTLNMWLWTSDRVRKDETMFGFFVPEVGCSHDVFVCLVSKLSQTTEHERPIDGERDVSTTMTIRTKKRWECPD